MERGKGREQQSKSAKDGKAGRGCCFGKFAAETDQAVACASTSQILGFFSFPGPTAALKRLEVYFETDGGNADARSEKGLEGALGWCGAMEQASGAPAGGMGAGKTGVPNSVAVHPIVLLGVVDHYNRVCKDTKKRAVGVLLGHTARGKVSCTNSFALPFEEDERAPDVWFLDHTYLEAMMAMFRKVNTKETIVGWYSTGPKVRQGDHEIHELMRSYHHDPVLVIIDVKPKDLGLPTEAYVSVEQSQEDSSVRKIFAHLPSEIEAVEAEEVGVGHLLRDIQDSSVSTLTGELAGKLAAMRSLLSRLHELQSYLVQVSQGKLPLNQDIMYNMQDIFNLLPAFNVESLVNSFAVKTNDMMLVLYVSSMIRSIIAMHNLIDNKILLKGMDQVPEAASSSSATAPSPSS
ncbi:26S proteasome non-ATPase regulatory subunit 7-like A [Porphyridium purpureum]|uniref:26S proteasome non-ATPase regulatory subunit 7-like A n=1 Tax=Porphyridium purpureum TaxID=35688 RepID=A0A5J4YQL2_PORPP|nr:26S proteasome non-ATPase regulatory subunit 7-like A [Porphyridium purpureum]|eukprot:POR6446..scf222_8